MPSINQPPTITSNGGGATGTVSVPENATAVTIVTATDPNPGTTLQYSIAGGADASLFRIDGVTGALSLIAVPDYEAPGDANLDNIYEVVVRASDGSLFDDQALAVNISNVADNFVPVTKFGSQFLVNTTTTDAQYGPSVAAFSDGRFVSVWSDNNTTAIDDSARSIRGQLFDATGAKSGGQFLVNTTTLGMQDDPSVAMLADGRFVVTWADYSGSAPYGPGGGPAVRAQIFNGSGTKSGAEFLVSATSEAPGPVVKGLADGRFVVAWCTLSTAGTDNSMESIRAQVFNSNGTKSGAEFQVNTTTTELQYEQQITTLNNGDFVITWTDRSATGGDQSGQTVRGQIFHPTGAPVGTEFVVNTTTLNDQRSSSITALTDGRFVATWSDASETGGDTSGLAVRGQVFNANGSKSGAEFLVDSTTTASNQYAPSVAGLPDGRFVAAWIDAGTAIRAQVFNSDGSKSSVELLVDVNNSSHWPPSVAALADGRFVVNWSDQRQADGDTSSFGVRGQIFDPRGEAVHLTGTARNDDFVGTRFDDSMYGGTGNDRLDGGAGNDTAIFQQAHTEYTIQALGSGKLAVSGPDGFDTLSNFEHLQFSDTTLDAHNGAMIVLDLDTNDWAPAGTRYVTTFVENGPAAVIGGNIQITDINPTGPQTVTAAKVVLTNAQPGDSLSMAGSVDGISAAIDNSVPGVVTLTLTGGNSTGAMSASAYQTALSLVRFSNSTHNPGAADRDIAVTVSEGGLDSNVAHATVHIMTINDAPVAQNGSVVGNEDNTITGTLPATDVDGPSLMFSRVTSAAHGNVTVNPNGSFSYTPNPNFNGTDSFTFKANDGSFDSNVATVSLTINPVNDAPVAQSTSASGNEDTQIGGTVVATDIDSAAAQLTYALFGANGGAAHGTVSMDAGGHFIYTPNPNYNGTDSFTFKASDGSLTGNAATVSLTINPVNDAPLAQSAAAAGNQGAAIHGTLVASDVDSPSLSFSKVANAAHGTVDVSANGSFTYTPDANFNGADSFTFKANDGALDSNVATIGLTINPVADPPVSNDPPPTDPTPSNPTPAGPAPTVHWLASVVTGSHPAGWLPTGLADFTNDGTSDLAWFNATTHDVEIWKINNGQWADSVDIGTHPGAWQPVGFADFTNDGTSDALWFDPVSHHLDLWKIANGEWAGSVDIGAHPAGWHPAGVGDFNNDGTADVLWYNPTTGNAEIWKTQDGQWAGSVDLGNHPAGWQPSVIGDFNGDGTDDISWYNATTGDIDIWKIVDGQWAGSVDLGSHPLGWQPLGAGDFNKDGTSDIAWYNPTTNNIDVWLIANEQWAGGVDVGSHPTGSTAVGIGDFDHNGVSDVMWRDTSTGHIETWMLAYS